MWGGSVFDQAQGLSIPRMGEAGGGFCIMRHMAVYLYVAPSGSAVLPRAAYRTAKELGAILAAVVMLSACAPELNWREVQLSDADGLSALFPCKPDRLERKVPWPGLPDGLTMRMLTCRAQDRTWALSYAKLPDVTLVEPALRQWPNTMRDNLARAAGPSTTVNARHLGPVTVPHMTPSAHTSVWHFDTALPDQRGQRQPMHIQSWHFVHGMTVFQASVSGAAEPAGAQSSEDVAQAFFGGFHFPG
jgi:hypothetical protein